MGNLKVSDSEYEEITKAYLDIATAAESDLNTYFESMSRILINSLPSGIIYDNLTAFVIEAQKIKGVLDGILEELSPKCTSFVEDIDAKDEYLY